MTSLKRYIRAYISVMPKRIKYFQAAYAEKKKIDGRILKGKGTRKDIYELLRITGEDTLFTHAEKKNRQTIRHYVWKMSKSMNFLYAGRSRFLALASKATAQDAAKLTKFVNVFAQEAGKRCKALEQLDKVLVREVAELESIKKRRVLDWEPYTRLFDSENTELNELAAYGKEIKPYLRSFTGYAKAVADGMLKGVEEMGSIGPLILGISLLYAVALVYWPESYMATSGIDIALGKPPYRVDIMANPLIHILGAGTFLTLLVGTGGNAFVFVKDFVRESI